ncbi:uncharacterized protein LOC114248686 [Bombyx mandarina]|uniref:Uncharacterized protein LOC114248686 n=1 Tax=Bombyx mandarina TaxID=7092 RepID=A0A6J2K887_BOMMA|nr:uncharacterized protein LOC114248686 [Bombyx mandarina]
MTTVTEKEHVEDQRPAELFRVGVRVPPFWPEEPEIWFAQVEGQFAISGITSDTTKFNYVIGQLDHQFSKEVKDIIISPPATDKYEKLKLELIKRLSASHDKKVKQLLMHEELGERRPSQFLRHLQSLAGPTVPEEFVKTIWTSRLPRNIQTVIAAQPTSSLEVLADLADKIQDIATPAPQVAAAQAGPGSTMDAMAREIAELRKQLQNLSSQLNSQDRRSRSTQRRDRSRSMTRSVSNYRRFPECYYHFKFGSNARNCIKPCDFEPESRDSSPRRIPGKSRDPGKNSENSRGGQ